MSTSQVSTRSRRERRTAGIVLAAAATAALAVGALASPTDAAPDTTADAAVFDTIRNDDFDAYADASQQEIIDSAPWSGFANDDFTEVVGRADNGPQPGQGQFRMACAYSHFAFDDPIVKRDQPGAAHLHMFWGNTRTDASSRVSANPDPDDSSELVENGGGSCQGGVLNRSAYWIPAMYAGPEGEGRQLVVPDDITIYYKSYRPAEVNPIPQGVELLGGNLDAQGRAGATFEPSNRLNWGCYDGSLVDERVATIPTGCDADRSVHATIQFPQCLAVDGSGDPVLRSDDHFSHFQMIDNSDACPSSHPYRIPQISYLVSWPNLGTAEVSTWRLSCDAGHRSDEVDAPGGCLHGDFIGGWNESTMDAWITGCHNGPEGPRNCSNGQTGQNGSNRSLRRISPLNDYTGPNLFDDPCPTCTMGAASPTTSTTTTTPAPVTTGPVPSTTTSPVATTSPSTTAAPVTTSPDTTSPTTTTSPVTTTPPVGDAIALPGRIEAEDYVDFFDDSRANLGGQYRDDAVDIEASRDVDRGHSVGWTKPGEWLEYRIDGGTDVRFDLTARVASERPSPGRLDITIDGNSVGSIDVDFTGNWYQWETLDGGRISVPPGASTLRVTWRGTAAINLNWIELN